MRFSIFGGGQVSEKNAAGFAVAVDPGLELEINTLERAINLCQTRIGELESIVRPLRLAISSSKSAMVTAHLKLVLQDYEPDLTRENVELARLREEHSRALARRSGSSSGS
ncbi:MAG: hypothetical protein ACRD5M_05045 [Candidatus Acidiferrales bacterium]